MIVVDSSGTTSEVPDVPATPEQRAAIEASYLVTFTGAGRTWNLNNGPVFLCPGVQGLFSMPPIEPWTSAAPAVPGRRRLGGHVDEQTLKLPVETTGETWAEWRDVDKAWLRSLLADDAFITVTAPDGISYTMGVYYDTDGNPADAVDPLVFASRVYADNQVTAPWPFWRGQDVVARFTFDEDLGFYDVAVPVINPGGDTDQASISNPGDVGSWAIYQVRGPSTSWSVGTELDPDDVAGPAVVSSAQVPIGAGLVTVDSTPGVKTVIDDTGARVPLRMLDEVGFRPIPSGVDIPLVAAMTGTGAGSEILVTLPTWYWRPV